MKWVGGWKGCWVLEFWKLLESRGYWYPGVWDFWEFRTMKLAITVASGFQHLKVYEPGWNIAKEAARLAHNHGTYNRVWWVWVFQLSGRYVN